jgi:SAM-dependent methyltransferase
MNISPSRLYTEQFYAQRAAGSTQSAAAIVPALLRLVPATSVVDVGCGNGTWLSVFREHGVTDVLGLDGEYVQLHQLLIPHRQFRPADLVNPPSLGRRFDLALSIEVAEHLPEEVADRFIDYLTSLAPVVAFSAAIPGQGGTNHVNEQWPDYWVSRFRDRGFVPVDCLRSLVWRDSTVDWWYAQNMLLFCSGSYLEAHRRLGEMACHTDVDRLAIVHPRAYLAARRESHDLREQLRPENMSLRQTLASLPGIFGRALRRRLTRR